MIFVGLFAFGIVSVAIGYLIGASSTAQRLQVKIGELERRTPLNCNGIFHLFHVGSMVCRCKQMSAGKMLAKARKHG